MFDDIIGCPWYISTIWHVPQYSRYSVPAGETLAGESTGQDPPPSASSPTSTWPTSPAQDPTLWVNIIWYLAKTTKKRKRCQCNWANRQISWGMANHLVILQQHKMYQRGESLKDFFDHISKCCYVIFLVVFLETFGVAIFQGAKAIASVQRSPRPPECPWCISGAGHPACVFGALPHSPLMCPWCTGADIIFTLAWCSTRIPWYALDTMCNALCWAYQGGMQ